MMRKDLIYIFNIVWSKQNNNLERELKIHE